MLTTLTRNWWVVVLRGVFAVLFGIGALLWPGFTLAALVLVWGAYAIVDGIFALTAAIVGGTGERGGSRWAFLFIGLVSLGAGVIALVSPGITALALLFVIAAWAIVHGVLEIIAAVHLRKVIEHEWLLGLAGAASIFFGLLLMLRPGAGALALLWAIGGFAIVFGALTIALGLRLRGLRHHHPPAAAAMA